MDHLGHIMFKLNFHFPSSNLVKLLNFKKPKNIIPQVNRSNGWPLMKVFWENKISLKMRNEFAKLYSGLQKYYLNEKRKK